MQAPNVGNGFKKRFTFTPRGVVRSAPASAAEAGRNVER